MSGPPDRPEDQSEPDGPENQATAAESASDTTASNITPTTTTLSVASLNPEDVGNFKTVEDEAGWRAIQATTASPSVIYFSNSGPEGRGLYGFKRFDSGHSLILLASNEDNAVAHGRWSFIEVKDSSRDPRMDDSGHDAGSTMFRILDDTWAPICEASVRAADGELLIACSSTGSESTSIRKPMTPNERSAVNV